MILLSDKAEITSSMQWEMYFHGCDGLVFMIYYLYSDISINMHRETVIVHTMV